MASNQIEFTSGPRPLGPTSWFLVRIPFEELMKQVEAQLIKTALKLTDGTLEGAAACLGVAIDELTFIVRTRQPEIRLHLLEPR